MKKTTERLIFHIDVNSAFLSWEAARRVAAGGDDLRLVPSAVGGDRAIGGGGVRVLQKVRVVGRVAEVCRAGVGPRLAGSA